MLWELYVSNYLCVTSNFRYLSYVRPTHYILNLGDEGSLLLTFSTVPIIRQSTVCSHRQYVHIFTLGSASLFLDLSRGVSCHPSTPCSPQASQETCKAIPSYLKDQAAHIFTASH